MTEGVSRLIGFVASLRGEDLRQQAMALWTARGRLARPDTLVVVALVLVAGATLVATVWSRPSQAGERDFEFPVICASCAHHYRVSREAMFAQITAARQKGHSAAGTGTAGLCLCPKCGKLAIFRAVECPKCGGAIPPPFASVNGTPISPRCAACGWSAGKSGG